MNSCPFCDKEIDAKDIVCPHCEKSIVDAPTAVIDKPLLEDEQKKVEEPFKELQKVPLYRRPVFYAALIITVIITVLAGAGIGTFYYLKVSRQSSFKQKIKSVWLDVSQQSKAFSQTTQATSNSAELKNISDEASTLYELVTRKQTEVATLETPTDYEYVQNNLAYALSKYSDYLMAVRILLNKSAASVSSKDFRALDSSAEEAQTAIDNFLGSVSFIRSDMPDDVFEASKKIEPIMKAAQKQTQVEQVEALKKQQETDKQEATKTVTDFMQARIQDNFVAMRRYLTANENKYFDPEAEKKAQGNSYPVDFKVTNVAYDVKGNTFTIDGDETVKDYQGHPQTIRWRFKVVKSQTVWLIDKRELIK
ncbi:MAG: zinc ribbon domain-containing protein [Actinobacteria bacterium]|nr:MAG: zinc ribbon domain-containing protein [Actinomycetota bacterium]